MSKRTFSLDCDLDRSLAELDAYTPCREMPDVSEFHPLAIVGENMVLCVHDDANACTRQIVVTHDLLEKFEDSEAVAEHLRTIVRADFN
jgi:hypothetical protein